MTTNGTRRRVHSGSVVYFNGYTWNSYSTPAVMGMTQTLTQGLRRTYVNEWGETVMQMNPVVITKIKTTGSGGDVSIPTPYGYSLKLQGDVWAIANLVYQTMYGSYYPEAIDQRYKDATIVGALAKVNEISFGAGLFLAELAETLALLRRPLASTVKLANEMYKRARRKLRNRPTHQPNGRITPDFADALGGQWLEYRYGIMPLVFDVADLAEMVDKGLNFLDDKLIVKAKGATKKSALAGLAGTTNYVPGIGIIPSWSSRKLVTQKYVTKVYCSQNLDCTNIAEKALYQLGLHKEHVAGLVWELIPFSFVGDWFINVGDWLKARQLNPTVTVHGSCTSVTQSEFSLFKCVACKTPYGTKSVSGSGNFQIDYKRLTRTLDEKVPPFPVVNINSLSWKRQLDACALTWGTLHSFFRKRQN